MRAEIQGPGPLRCRPHAAVSACPRAAPSPRCIRPQAARAGRCHPALPTRGRRLPALRAATQLSLPAAVGCSRRHPTPLTRHRPPAP